MKTLTGLFLLIFYLLVGNIFASSICEESFKKSEYKFNDYEITQCDCQCTMENNSFVIKDIKKETTYRFNELSKLAIDKSNLNEGTHHPLISFYRSSRKRCDESLVLKKGYLYLYTLIPSGNRYCYQLSGFFDENRELQILDKYLESTIIKKVQNQKQYLHKKPNKGSKTKMYLIQDDKVEIQKEKSSWYYILYRGKRDIKAWIPKNSVDKN